MTAGWGETEVLMDVSSRRLAPVQHRHLPARGLLSLLSLLRAFLLNIIKKSISPKVRYYLQDQVLVVVTREFLKFGGNPPCAAEAVVGAQGALSSCADGRYR